MSKKKYIAPELKELILEHSDIITKSIGSTSGDNDGEDDEFGDWT